ncbi:MAG: ribosome biogenesis GTPase YlqF [Oscillospiraceae bacterium]
MAENINTKQIQWFPGHMAKTRRIMQANLKLVDAVAEIIDARIPYSSRNPEMDALTGAKPRVVVLNKADTADEAVTAQWLAFFQKNNTPAIALDCRSGKNVGRFSPLLREVLRERIEGWQRKGMTGRPIRIMLAGIPNVGKSSFINRLAGARLTKVEDRPGVTRGKQWISLESDLELLDMPGVLWPKFEDRRVGEHLAFTGAVRDEILDTETLACRLVRELCETEKYREALYARYKIDAADILAQDEADDLTGCAKGFAILERIATKRGFLISGGGSDTLRCAVTVIDEFRGGKLGRITLERPE